ncbi:uncharacterized protein LOC112568196 [Pomacea canaliculata]|uniref:uncharacterized protein LOC112568196 n=1 Tax=Pomacea canaliculata TaxID=400727 RepID=UPI000D72CA79|nr:uncharacterized protein LOC112568196 [Pomacea canaliculata]
MPYLLHIKFALFVIQAILCLKQEQCTVSWHLQEKSLSVLENSFANVTFEMNSLACSESNMPYKVMVNTKTNSGDVEYDGTVTYLGDTCTATPFTSVRCITPTGPAELHRRVNRSHVAVEWNWKWKDTQFSSFTTMRKELAIAVLYPPGVTSLTVNGDDVNGNILVNESQEVNISCSFDKGNPPTNFLLLNERGHELQVYRDEQTITHSLRLQCAEDWPTVKCEGNASQKNRSVSFLVSCPPQFMAKHPQVTAGAAYESWTLRVKAHTTEIENCLAIPLSLGENKNREVSCTLTGSPPELLLTVLVNNEDTRGMEGLWSLSFRNERGSSGTLVFTKPSSKYISLLPHMIDR